MEALFSTNPYSLDINLQSDQFKLKATSMFANNLNEAPADLFRPTTFESPNLSEGNLLQTMLQLLQNQSSKLQNSNIPTETLANYIQSRHSEESKPPSLINNVELGTGLNSNIFQLFQRPNLGLNADSSKLQFNFAGVPNLSSFIPPTPSNLLMPPNSVNFLGLVPPGVLPLGATCNMNKNCSYTGETDSENGLNFFPLKIYERNSSENDSTTPDFSIVSEEGRRTLAALNKSPLNIHGTNKISNFTGIKGLELNPTLKALDKHEDMLRKFTSYEECGSHECRNTGAQEHFHCTHCERVISRREEMIRHIKWHRKREESLQYGFMRYSPSDDCKNNLCVHNGKQTHYHCLQANCTKIYISTSDVQMHANYHRKDAVIMQDGFQRFRATENCGLTTCAFQHERTTHFHCRRPECGFTFKNKADIEKHKSHHQRNDSFAKDGFKKFIKYESCDYENCKYSRIMNHIHCIRPGCDYVVHSSSQILSHKRKHERRQIPEPFGCQSFPFGGDEDESRFPLTQGMSELEVVKFLQECISNMVIGTLNHLRLSEPSANGNSESFDISHTDPQVKELFLELQKRLVLSDGNGCKQWKLCEEKYGHFHCSWPSCYDRRGPLFRYRSHWIKHAWTGALVKAGMINCRLRRCSSITPHSHCILWPMCNYIVENGEIEQRTQELVTHLGIHDVRLENPPKSILSPLDFQPLEFSNISCVSAQDQPPRLESSHNNCQLEDLESSHEDDEQEDDSDGKTSNPEDGSSSSDTQSRHMQTDSGLAPRKRGRPPKHKRDIKVPHLNLDEDLPLDENLEVNLTKEMFLQRENVSPRKDERLGNIVCGVKFYSADGPKCIDSKCQFHEPPQDHYHCIRPRCYLASQSLVCINLHRREFHAHLTIEQGFEHFDRSIDCRRKACHNNRLNRHYHCIRPGCDYSFVRYSTMQQHARKHDEVNAAFEKEHGYFSPISIATAMKARSLQAKKRKMMEIKETSVRSLQIPEKLLDSNSPNILSSNIIGSLNLFEEIRKLQENTGQTTVPNLFHNFFPSLFSAAMSNFQQRPTEREPNNSTGIILNAESIIKPFTMENLQQVLNLNKGLLNSTGQQDLEAFKEESDYDDDEDDEDDDDDDENNDEKTHMKIEDEKTH